MTRWAMVADLERCVGCQTCTAACRHANATSPAVQWRKVLDIEAVARPEEAVRRMDIVLTATNSSVPVFDGKWLEAGTHVTSIVGSNVGLVKGGFAGAKRREIDDETLERTQWA